MPPARYLLARRLNQVRRDLQASPSLNITDAALLRGFGHLGRFSQHYYRLFGELPSQTRRSELTGHQEALNEMSGPRPSGPVEFEAS